MANREIMYRRFGPKALEAIINLVVNEINILRIEAGLIPRTQQQVLDALEAEYLSLPNYIWQNE